MHFKCFTKEMQYQLEDIGRQAAVVPAAAVQRQKFRNSSSNSVRVPKSFGSGFAIRIAFLHEKIHSKN